MFLQFTAEFTVYRSDKENRKSTFPPKWCSAVNKTSRKNETDVKNLQGQADDSLLQRLAFLKTELKYFYHLHSKYKSEKNP